MQRFFAAVLLSISAGAAQTGSARLPATEETALALISADALQADLSYLASDDLAGRDTPSPGLEKAADFIARHFREEGLEPAGPDGSYFQVAQFEQIAPDKETVRLELKSGDKAMMTDHVRVRSDLTIDYNDAQVFKLPEKGPVPAIEGRIIAGDEQRYGTRAAIDDLQARKPALILLLGRTREFRPVAPALEEADSTRVPVVQVRDSEAAGLLRRDRELTLSLHIPAPVRKTTALRNVAAILRGSDPVLRDQYVLLTAHYDHIGQNAKGIFHGANDNASGTASVIEIAGALAALNPHPKRSILFMTFFGEEKGLLGSVYYTRHPLVALKDTVADVNLEQMGRIDDTTGPEIGTFAFTGPSFSNLPAIVSAAAKLAGVETYKHEGADDFFERSDNAAFADKGIVSHTIAVAFEFSGYHGLGDTLDKINFANMAKVDRGVAAGVVALADETDRPKWSDSKATAKYREAAKN